MSDFDLKEIREEHFEDEPTGIEVEHDEEPRATRASDREEIRVSTKQFSIRQVMDQIDDGDLELAPDFQRNQVWKPWQKSGLVESILLQIPLPAFYFAETPEGLLRVVDGLQRLSTVHSFMRQEGFALTGLEYLESEVGGKTFRELELPWRRRMDNTQIFAHVIDPKTPARVTYDIFKRINTGGTPLKPQEIRHSMSAQRSRDFLKSCTALPEFHRATWGSLRNSARMDDREVVLRFCAFRLLGVDGYLESTRRSTEAFLLEATKWLDDPQMVDDAALHGLRQDFSRAMINAQLVFGSYAFRKWPEGNEAHSPINKALFESWSFALSQLTPEQATKRGPQIVAAARKLMTDDTKYLAAVTVSTGDPAKVELRFRVATVLVAAA
ncbi:DUF262 domain-containing protein [Saccharothrix violaceirubra]|uniref:GmrSD restriction endonucleases N-terminal domain-containing protein n=1 Tax=Saccharothrix violaceirubra TaxID=413306 RepID=A0A7W7WZJ4_9PSEU|nr:DUF262 domain-containing protein [Saccharothrix violaceirubra]MBB4969392.1 hypothetical protein [Saccharothrix violaceirubra]